MINYDLIPKSILGEGKKLDVLGVNEYAFSFDNIKKIIEILKEKEIPILGGDVYLLSDEKIYSTYDSWYMNKSDEKDFFLKSYEKTISYISDYINDSEGQFVFSIVF